MKKDSSVFRSKGKDFSMAALLVLSLGIGVPVARSTPAQSVRAVALIVEPVDEIKQVTLHGNTRPEALRPEFDKGAVDDSFPLNGMQLQLKRSPAHEAAAEALADELHRKGSPQFHQWLTAADYADQFGVHSQDIAAIRVWLSTHGFTVHAQSPSRMTIDFSGTAGQVREAFGTEIHRLEVNGKMHIANVRDPQVPAALAPAVEGVVSLHDFRPRPALAHRPQYNFPTGGVVTGAEFFSLVPADLAKIYRFDPLFAEGITGKGQSIALIENSDAYDPNDWQVFRKKFGLDAFDDGSLTTVHPGGCPDPGVNGDDLESIVDVEWASAAAPNAKLLLASCADTATTFGGLIAMQNLVNQPSVPAIMSLSFTTCEGQNGAAGNAAQRAVSLQAVLEGVSIFVSSGDQGAAECDFLSPAQSGIAVNGLASTPFNVAVGGTDFADTYSGTSTNYWSPKNGVHFMSAMGYVPEVPWNDTCGSALISSFLGYLTPYGANGFCAVASTYFIEPYGSGGGPSNCATGIESPDSSGATPSNGTCKGWKKPNWQNVVGNSRDGVRDLPDISLFAGDGVWNHAYIYCNSDPANGNPCVGVPSGWSYTGGTSFSAPIMAGMQALVNQVWGGRQGNPNPVYYAIARNEYGTHGNRTCDSSRAGGPAGTCTFNDITIGDSAMTCIPPYNCYDPGYDPNTAPGVIGVLSLSDNAYQPAYKSGVGWDFATGIGTVNATQLVLNPIWLFGAGP